MSDLGSRRRKARIESAAKTSARQAQRLSLRDEAFSDAANADEERDDFDMLSIYEDMPQPKL